MPVIAVLGDVNIDLVLDIPRYPREGGEGIATRQLRALGGSATNTASALAALNQDVRLIGSVGDDPPGREALEEIARRGIDTTQVRRASDVPTALNFVTVSPGGERTMFAYRGANVRLAPEALDPDCLDDVSLLHLSGYALLEAPQSDAARRALELAVARRIPVTLDIPGGVIAEIAASVEALLPQIDIVMLGIDDARVLCRGEPGAPDIAASTLLARGVGAVALKFGAGGARFYSHGGGVATPAFAVEAVDTTGAGDAFAAGCIIGRLAKLPPEEAGLVANALGALATTRHGAVPTGAAELLAFLATRVGPGQLAVIRAAVS